MLYLSHNTFITYKYIWYTNRKHAYKSYTVLMDRITGYHINHDKL